jgi:predicted heme/steroid binding protein
MRARRRTQTITTAPTLSDARARPHAPPRAPAPWQVFTEQRLAEQNGRAGAPLYIAILGEVFDVTSKPEFYGEGSTYFHFVGADGSRAFVTGARGPRAPGAGPQRRRVRVGEPLAAAAAAAAAQGARPCVPTLSCLPSL